MRYWRGQVGAIWVRCMYGTAHVHAVLRSTCVVPCKCMRYRAEGHVVLGEGPMWY